MNTRMIVLCVLFLTCGFVAKAQVSTEIPGGIVYSDGKDAIYYDFKAEESKNLTSDLNGAVVQHPFAVSENGKVLIWLQNSKFYLRELPVGNPRAVQVDRVVFEINTKTRRHSTGKNNIKEDLTWGDNPIRNMSLSPDGSRFAFDAIFQGPGWVFTGKSVYGEENNGPGTGHYFPFYAKAIDPYNGIFYLSTIYNRNDGDMDRDPIEMNFSNPRYGNNVRKPPVPSYKASWQDLPPPSPLTVEVTGHGLVETGEKIYITKTIKKSAYGLTFQNLQNWEEGKKLAAFIYQIGDQWGPLEIRTLDAKTQGEMGDAFRQSVNIYPGKVSELPERLQKCREWEIRLSLRSCEGLFWKPDGSLTFLSEGNLYSINALQIQSGIGSSGVEVKRAKRGGFRIVPVNNVFTAEPELVVQGINGACIHWISNDAFLFLARDGAVYLWNQGEIKNALYPSISSEFYYCSKSPFANIVYSNEANFPPAISGKDKAIQPQRWSYKDMGPNIGPIKTDWMYSNALADNYSVNIRVKKDLVKGIRKTKQEVWEYEYALPEENDLRDIKDPSQYGYRLRLPPNKGDVLGFPEYVGVPLNKIIILKSGNVYAAIKPLKLEPKELSKYGEPFVEEKWMTYEWKYWPEVIPPKAIARSDPAIIK